MNKIEWHPNGTPGPFLRDGLMIYALDETGNCNRFSARVDGGYTWRAHGRFPADSDRTTQEELEVNARAIAEVPAMVQALREARDALNFHYVEWDGEMEDAVPLQLARDKIDTILARIDKEG